MSTGYKAFKKIGKSNQRFEAEPTKEERFVSFIRKELAAPNKYNKTSLEKTAQTYGITDAREVKELVEFGLVLNARELTQKDQFTIPEKYGMLTYHYLQQVNLSLRTSTSILLQQYSTPIPIAYLMGIYIHADNFYAKMYGSESMEEGRRRFILEPSAGNGILTIAGMPNNFVVNEIDELRRKNLRKEEYLNVLGYDSSKPFPHRPGTRFMDLLGTSATDLDGEQIFDGIITNPPFAALNKEEYENFGGYEIRDLDHLMAIRALNLMRNDGRAAIIVGGHTKYDNRGVIQAGKNLKFLSYLYKHYFVEDVILVNGDLYSKMGTSFDIRIILINGRKPKPEGYAPNKANTNTDVVNTFKELYDRFEMVSQRGDLALENKPSEAQAQRIRIIKLKYKYAQ